MIAQRGGGGGGRRAAVDGPAANGAPRFPQALEQKVQESQQDRTIAVRNDETYAEEQRDIAKIRKKVRGWARFRCWPFAVVVGRLPCCCILLTWTAAFNSLRTHPGACRA